jgi:hypothetical protein
VEVPCASDGDRYACAPDAAARQLVVYPSSVVHLPTLELAWQLRGLDGQAAVAPGLKLVAEGGFGSLPGNAEAQHADGEGTVAYRMVHRGWQALGVRALLDFSFAP